jgi:hypothetical protein
VLLELFQELQVGEAEPHAFNPGEHLVRAGVVDFFGGIEFELAGADELDSVLGCGESCV